MISRLPGFRLRAPASRLWALSSCGSPQIQCGRDLTVWVLRGLSAVVLLIKQDEWPWMHTSCGAFRVVGIDQGSVTEWTEGNLAPDSTKSYVHGHSGMSPDPSVSSGLFCHSHFMLTVGHTALGRLETQCLAISLRMISRESCLSLSRASVST